MTQTCPTFSAPCRPCPDDQPVLNLSSEGPDDNIFVGVYDYPQDPVIGDLYNSTGCKAWCYSSVSQAAADACAAAQAADCALTDNGGGNPGCPEGGLCGDPDIPPTPPPPPGGFRSALYSLQCPTLASFISSVPLPPQLFISGVSLVSPEGAFTSTQSQSDADFKAANFTNQYYADATAGGTLTCNTPWYIFSSISQNCGEPEFAYLPQVFVDGVVHGVTRSDCGGFAITVPCPGSSETGLVLTGLFTAHGLESIRVHGTIALTGGTPAGDDAISISGILSSSGAVLLASISNSTGTVNFDHTFALSAGVTLEIHFDLGGADNGGSPSRIYQVSFDVERTGGVPCA